MLPFCLRSFFVNPRESTVHHYHQQTANGNARDSSFSSSFFTFFFLSYSACLLCIGYKIGRLTWEVKVKSDHKHFFAIKEIDLWRKKFSKVTFLWAIWHAFELKASFVLSNLPSDFTFFTCIYVCRDVFIWDHHLTIKWFQNGLEHFHSPTQDVKFKAFFRH